MEAAGSNLHPLHYSHHGGQASFSVHHSLFNSSFLILHYLVVVRFAVVRPVGRLRLPGTVVVVVVVLVPRPAGNFIYGCTLHRTMTTLTIQGRGTETTIPKLRFGRTTLPALRWQAGTKLLHIPFIPPLNPNQHPKRHTDSHKSNRDHGIY